MAQEQAISRSFLSNVSVYETTQKIYVVAEDVEQQGWRLLKFHRESHASELAVAEDPTLYTRAQVKSILACLHQGNLAAGGLLKVADNCPAIVGCFRWAAYYYLLLVTRTRTLGHIGGSQVFGIESTALIPLAPAGEFLPASVAAEEARARRLLSLVDLTKDFFFSFSWPIWATVQHTLEPTSLEDADTLEDAFNSDRVWTRHLTAPLRTTLGHARWTVPLVLGFMQQRRLSLMGKPLTLTLVARRSCRFAGTRYRKRGISDDGFVANDVEIEQILVVEGKEFSNGAGRVRVSCSGLKRESGSVVENDTAAVSSIVQVRGSVPLFWAQQTWDSTGTTLRPSIRMLHHLDPLYTATRKHFDDLRGRYGNAIQCLDLLRHGDSRQQESVLSNEYKSAIAFVNKRAPPQQRVGYIHWDLRRHARSLASNLLSDLQTVQAPLLERTGLFAATATPSSSLEKSAAGGEQREAPLRMQRGVVRTNCVDCLDRTNVAQFAYGLLALGAQAHALGLAPTPHTIDPQSSFAAELMGAYEAMGHALAQQYGGSEAHSGFFQRWRGDSWHASLQGRDLLTSIRRFYSNAVTDEDKQAAINLFLGAFVGALPATADRGGSWVPPRQRSMNSRDAPGNAPGEALTSSAVQLNAGASTSLSVPAAAEGVGGSFRLDASPAMAEVIEGDSPPSTPLPMSFSSASFSSELDGGADITLPEILRLSSSYSGTTRQEEESISLAQHPGGSGVSARGTSTTAGGRFRRVWQSGGLLQRGPTSADTTAAVSNTEAAVLESLDEILPHTLRHVRLSSGPLTFSSSAAAASWLSPTKPSPPPKQPSQQETTKPLRRLVRSTSAGESLARAVAFTFEGGGGGGGGGGGAPAGVTTFGGLGNRSARDLRGSLVFIGPGDRSNGGNGVSEDPGSPVLPESTGRYHTLAGLNLEGGPDLMRPPVLGSSDSDTLPGDASNLTGGTIAQGMDSPFSKARRLSFASLSALRRLVAQGVGGGSSTPQLPPGASGCAGSNSQMGISRAASALALEDGAAGRIGVALPARNKGGGKPGHAGPDMSWMLSQYQAVAHGLDDLGLPPEVAPLWRPGSNVVGSFAEARQKTAGEWEGKMEVLATPLGPSERRAAEQHAAAQLRTALVLPMPGKAF